MIFSHLSSFEGSRHRIGGVNRDWPPGRRAIGSIQQPRRAGDRALQFLFNEESLGRASCQGFDDILRPRANMPWKEPRGKKCLMWKVVKE